jgi:hypothetical protein
MKYFVWSTDTKGFAIQIGFEKFIPFPARSLYLYTPKDLHNRVSKCLEGDPKYYFPTCDKSSMTECIPYTLSEKGWERVAAGARYEAMQEAKYG